MLAFLGQRCSQTYGEAQGKSALHLIGINSTWDLFTSHINELVINPGDWSEQIYTGKPGGTFKDGLRFMVSAGEVRPKNMAIRIWKRVA